MASYPTYTWNVGDLSFGDTGIITAVAQVKTLLSAGTQMINTALVTTALAEPFTGNNSAEATVTVINVGPVVTKDDWYTVTEDTVLYVQASGPYTSVLANDVDLNNDPLWVLTYTQPISGGAVTVNPSGYFTYTPPLHFYGADAFSYVATDGWLTDSASVTITVFAVNDPPTFTLRAGLAVFEDAGMQVEVGWTSAISPGGRREETQGITLSLSSSNPGLFRPGWEPQISPSSYTAPYPQSGDLYYWSEAVVRSRQVWPNRGDGDPIRRRRHRFWWHPQIGLTDLYDRHHAGQRPAILCLARPRRVRREHRRLVHDHLGNGQPWRVGRGGSGTDLYCLP
jgi:hypothetical protein